jgi:glucokinase
MILAGDIGGTKVNLAHFEVKERGLTSGGVSSYPSRDHSSLDEIARAFFEQHRVRPEFACFGIAGPVRNGRSQLTNLDWTLDASDLARSLGLKQVWLINDLEANAHGIAGLAPEDFVTLGHGAADAAGTLAIISAGTGLGEAGLLWDGQRHLVIPSEGGHADFAPRTDLDIELLKFLRKKFHQVSWENVLSGPGFVHIYEFLRDAGHGTEPDWLKQQFKETDPAAAITRAGLAKTCDLCVKTLDQFAMYYGAEAGNLALKMLATGGVYVGGGIAPKILEKLKDGTFMKAFVGQGRMSELLAAMPVRVIMNDKTALIGAARYAALRAGKIV